MKGLISIGTLVLYHPLSLCCDTVANSIIKVKHLSALRLSERFYVYSFLLPLKLPEGEMELFFSEFEIHVLFSEFEIHVNSVAFGFRHTWLQN